VNVEGCHHLSDSPVNSTRAANRTPAFGELSRCGVTLGKQHNHTNRSKNAAFDGSSFYVPCVSQLLGAALWQGNGFRWLLERVLTAPAPALA